MIEVCSIEVDEKLITGICKKQNFAELPVNKTRKKTGEFCGHREKQFYALGLNGTRNSCVLGVPPITSPKRCLSRARKNHIEKVVKIGVSRSFESSFYTKCVEQKRNNPYISTTDIGCLPIQSFVPPVTECDQYDFLNCDMKIDPDGFLLPYGKIPHRNGCEAFLPERLAHYFTYLFKRGFYFQRQGSLLSCKKKIQTKKIEPKKNLPFLS